MSVKNAKSMQKTMTAVFLLFTWILIRKIVLLRTTKRIMLILDVTYIWSFSVTCLLTETMQDWSLNWAIEKEPHLHTVFSSKTMSRRSHSVLWICFILSTNWAAICLQALEFTFYSTYPPFFPRIPHICLRYNSYCLSTLISLTNFSILFLSPLLLVFLHTFSLLPPPPPQVNCQLSDFSLFLLWGCDSSLNLSFLTPSLLFSQSSSIYLPLSSVFSPSCFFLWPGSAGKAWCSQEHSFAHTNTERQRERERWKRETNTQRSSKSSQFL